MNFLNRYLIIITVIVMSVSAFAAEVSKGKWIKGYGVLDCKKICRDENHKPVRSGIYYPKKDAYFFVCSLYIHGKRPGYNLEGEGNCTVGTGEDPRRNNEKRCLCSKPPVNYNWITGSVYSDCSSVCFRKELLPVTPGKYKDQQDGAYLYVCSINTLKRGWRSGYNLEGTKECVSGSGDVNSPRDRKKRCLCTGK